MTSRSPKFIYSGFIAVVTLFVTLYEGVNFSSQTHIFSVQDYWTMFQLSAHDENRWSLLDAHHEIVFVGTLSECEDWLDRMENVQPVTVETKWVFHRAFRSLLSFFSRKSQPPHISASSTIPNESSERSSLNQSERVSSWLVFCS